VKSLVDCQIPIAREEQSTKLQLSGQLNAGFTSGPMLPPEQSMQDGHQMVEHSMWLVVV
jgi:hypothetical protein